MLSASHEEHTASTVSSTPINPMDAFHYLFAGDNTPSPKKALPDFTSKISDDNSVASGDDSAGWEMEEDRVLNVFLAQTEAEDVLDDLSVDVRMKEIHEFMLISGEGEKGTEGQHADGAAEVAPSQLSTRQDKLCFRSKT